ncbi:MAG: tetratricopeptide repeat protein [Methylacidiphilales bacterium]|nr:tetratricopeptide repeat protein [Candidatus Methylacidiphilales bacterium]
MNFSALTQAIGSFMQAVGYWRLVISSIVIGIVIYMTLLWGLWYMLGLEFTQLLTDPINFPLFVFALFFSIAVGVRILAKYIFNDPHRVILLKGVINRTLLSIVVYVALLFSIIVVDFYDAKRDPLTNQVLAMSKRVFYSEYHYRPISWYRLLAQLQTDTIGRYIDFAYPYAWILLESNSLDSNREARKILFELANRGKANAEYLVGKMYEEGKGVSQNYLLAQNWYQKSAEHGLSEGMCLLGKRLALDESNRENIVLAHKWINVAISNRSPSCVAKDLKLLEAKLTPDELAKAQKEALVFRSKLQ